MIEWLVATAGLEYPEHELVLRSDDSLGLADLVLWSRKCRISLFNYSLFIIRQTLRRLYLGRFLANRALFKLSLAFLPSLIAPWNRVRT